MSDQTITYGDLGDHATVFHDESWGYDQITVWDSNKGRAYLAPRQFLLLLDWGNLNRPAIERLAKEREHG